MEGIVEEVDQDGSGTVDFGEFLAMMTGWGGVIRTSIKLSNTFKIYPKEVQVLSQVFM